MKELDSDLIMAYAKQIKADKEQFGKDIPATKWLPEMLVRVFQVSEEQAAQIGKYMDQGEKLKEQIKDLPPFDLDPEAKLYFEEHIKPSIAEVSDKIREVITKIHDTGEKN